MAGSLLGGFGDHRQVQTPADCVSDLSRAARPLSADRVEPPALPAEPFSSVTSL